MADNPKIISLENVCYKYRSEKGEVLALEAIDLDITEGEFICLLGPSGCGKSTLLKILVGFILPSSGRASMEGEPIQKPDWHRGVVFQSANLYPWLNVRKNVEFGLNMRKFPKDQIHATADKYLAQVGLLEFALHKPYELSGGMQQCSSGHP